MWNLKIFSKQCNRLHWIISSDYKKNGSLSRYWKTPVPWFLTFWARLVFREWNKYEAGKFPIHHKKAAKLIGVFVRLLEVFQQFFSD